MNKATVPARPYLFLPHHCHWLAPFLPFEALLDLPFNFFQMFHFLSSCRSLPQAVLCPLSSVQSLSRVWLFATPWTAARQASMSITDSQSLLRLMPIESVMPSNHFILCRPLLLPPSIFPSIRGFSNDSVLCIRWPKYWSFSFSPSSEYSGLISFRMDWLDLLAVQGTFKSLLQHHSSKASILWHSASLYSSSHNHTWPLGRPYSPYIKLKSCSGTSGHWF